MVAVEFDRGVDVVEIVAEFVPRLGLRVGTVRTVSRTSSSGESGASSSASMWMLNSLGEPRSGMGNLAIGSGALAVGSGVLLLDSGASDTRGDGSGAGGRGV